METEWSVLLLIVAWRCLFQHIAFILSAALTLNYIDVQAYYYNIMSENSDRRLRHNSQSNGIEKRASSMAIVKFSTFFYGEQAKENERKKKNVQNGMESADCLWSHYVQNEMHALNFLAILDIKYTVIYLFFHFTFYVKFFWFSKTYKQLIQVLAEVQHDLWLYSHVSLLSSVRG
ncbi:hypothetical protein T4A_7147 [Trichinella pseudospiralis]|uniref:Uncharacterized protein n=1 Tax=Trichinella pseudospiralis TaxID=6337 RepID=A0A0V1EG95_TRIPS|nr:hypothetical protein T4A_7147 [Trichinella pseudospiralis]